MQATFYYNASDKRYMNKNISAKYSNITIQVLEPSSVVRPSLKVSSGLIGNNVNYVYVNELERYYYITDWIMENGYIRLECEVDVLMSFKSAIKEQNVIVARQEHKYNLYQNDERFKLYNYSAVKTLSFPHNNNAFNMDTTNFVLAVVGNSSNT